nr:hypothetical protein [Candidatus Gracilibacteria bacterium]
MKIETGTSRLSFVGNKYTLKLPSIDFSIFGLVYNIVYGSYKSKKSLDYIGKTLKHNITHWFYTNLDNIRANLIEYRLGKKYPELVMKTRISVFGILNIQESGKVLSEEDNDKIWSAMISYFSNHNNAIAGGHAFYDSGDFARDANGKVKLIDAGSKRVEKILESEGENMLKAFNEFEQT